MILRIVCAIAVVTSATTMSVSAQGPSDAVRAGWDSAKRNMVASARTMPDAKYSFKPVESVRSFGAILAHVAGANYEFCAGVRGEKSPFSEDSFEKTAKTPADILKALQDSITYCDAAYKALTDANAGELRSVFGSKTSRISALMDNTSHNNEHYGNLVTYLRINGLVPPSSQPSK